MEELAARKVKYFYISQVSLLHVMILMTNSKHLQATSKHGTPTNLSSKLVILNGYNIEVLTIMVEHRCVRLCLAPQQKHLLCKQNPAVRES